MNCWASVAFKFSAGSKILDLYQSGTEWSNFCYGQSLGCARFKTKVKGDKVNFGFVKILSDKIVKADFEKFCKGTFSETKKIDSYTSGFVGKKDHDFEMCSWAGIKDSTIVIWKDGVSLMITMTEKGETSSVISMVKGGKIYDKI